MSCPTGQDNPAQPGFRITEITAFTAIGADDEEGVCAFLAPNGTWMPMIAADQHRADDLRQIARTMFVGQDIRERRFVPEGGDVIFAKMGVRYKLVATGKNRWNNGKVHLMFFVRENKDWRLLCRPNDPTGYFVHDLMIEQDVTCKVCQRKDPR